MHKDVIRGDLSTVEDKCAGLLGGDAVVALSVGEPGGMNIRFVGGDGLLDTAGSCISKNNTGLAST